MSPNSQISETDGRWRWLYLLGGVVAFLTFLYIPVQIVTFMTVPEPTEAIGWFNLFQSSKLQGLLSFEFLFIVISVIGITTNLALYVALRRVDESWMAIALAFSFIGAICIIVARPAIDMMYLSDKFATATSEAQRLMFQTAGETLLSMRHGSAFHVSYNLANINLLIIPLVMLRSKIFSKTAAYMGIAAGLLGFGLYIPGIGIWLSVLSVVFMGVWDILVGIKLIQLGRGAKY
jgi:hypothetical protein